MYPLPDNFNGEVFVGRSPSSVLFSANTVSVAFDDNLGADPSLAVTTMGQFVHHTAPDGGDGFLQRPPVASSKLMRIIDVPVSRVEIQRPSTLILHFRDGQSLTFLDDTYGVYESYHVTMGDKLIIV